MALKEIEFFPDPHLEVCDVNTRRVVGPSAIRLWMTKPVAVAVAYFMGQSLIGGNWRRD